MIGHGLVFQSVPANLLCKSMTFANRRTITELKNIKNEKKRNTSMYQTLKKKTHRKTNQTSKAHDRTRFEL